MTEQWNIPATYDELVGNGETRYEILGVETWDNMDSMRRFVEAVGIPPDVIEVDDGTQLTLRHPDPTLKIVIDAGGLGDFFDSGFNVTVISTTEGVSYE